MQSPGWWAERNQTRIAEACPSPPLAGEREGPAPKAWEGEVVLGNWCDGTTPPTLPSPPQAGGEGELYKYAIGWP